MPLQKGVAGLGAGDGQPEEVQADERAPPGMPPDQGVQLELEAGDAPLSRSWPVKPATAKLSDSELAELRAQPIDLLDRGCIQRSTAGHAAAAVFARKPDGSWCI